VKSIAAEFGVTPSRVSQLCGEALALLRCALEDRAGGPGNAGAASVTSLRRRTRYLDDVRAARRRQRLARRPRAETRPS